MILSKKQIQKIKEIVQTYFHSFVFQNLESPTTDHFKNAYLAGKLRGNAGPEALSNKTYDQFLTEIFNRSLGQTSLDQRTLEIAKTSISHYLDNLMNRTIDTIIGSINNKNRQAHMESIGESPTTFQSAVRDSRSINELVAELRDKTQDVARDWERVVRTELATIHNQGAVNAIVERNKVAGVSKEDTLVYAQGPLDDATCDQCRKHYHDGTSYKVYRLSELLANGTNVGVKTKEWKAIVPPMHPKCRHRLIELLPGWTLDKEGKQIYVGPDHHELNHSMKKSLEGKTPTFTGHKLHKRIKFQGMDISIENRKGSNRSWKDHKGREGKTLMRADYGYIRRTLGNDGDHVDAYIGPNKDSAKVFVIHQNRPDTQKFDEDKVMLGFNSSSEAKKTYLQHYDNPKFFGSMDEMTVEEFKDKVLGKKVDMIKALLDSLSKK